MVLNFSLIDVLGDKLIGVSDKSLIHDLALTCSPSGMITTDFSMGS